MKQPPALARILLNRLGPRDQSLVGDLYEEVRGRPLEDLALASGHCFSSIRRRCRYSLRSTPHQLGYRDRVGGGGRSFPAGRSNR